MARRSSWRAALCVAVAVCLLQAAQSADVISTEAGSGRTSGPGCVATATLGTSACLNSPFGILLDSTNTNLYIADQNNAKVRKLVLSSGIISTIAGTGTTGSSGDGDQATSALLSGPESLALDSSGQYLYLSDYINNNIRKVNLGTGIISLVAGTGSTGATGDGAAATLATLNTPFGLAIDNSTTFLYVADSSNNKVRRIDMLSGIISTFAGRPGPAGSSGDGGAATSAKLRGPYGLAIDSSGSYLYVADYGNNKVRRIDMLSGIISTFAGNGTFGSSGDGGAATSATLSSPYGLAIDSSGQYLYIGDYNDNKVRRVSLTTNIVTTFAGTGARSGVATVANGDGGDATSATLNSPSYITVDRSGSYFYIADSSNNKVRKVSVGATVSPSVAPSATPTRAPTAIPTATPIAVPTAMPPTAVCDTSGCTSKDSLSGACGVGSICISTSAEVIAGDAFSYATSLTAVSFAGCSNLTHIEENAFMGATSLATVDFSGLSALTTIDSSAFANTALRTVRIPASVTSINAYAFAYIPTLTDVCWEGPSMPPGVDPEAFYGSTSVVLANITSCSTDTPTAIPTAEPTTVPTATPSVAPTARPTARPSSEPSSYPSSQPTSSPTSSPSRSNLLLQNPLKARWTPDFAALKLRSYLAYYLAFFVALLALLLFVDLSGVGNRMRQRLLLSALQARVYMPAAAHIERALEESQVVSALARDNASMHEQAASAFSEKRVVLKKAFASVGDSDDAKEALGRQTDEDYKLLLEYLLLKRCLLGCGDVLFEGGCAVTLLGLRLPPGLAEDFMLYVCNNHSILSCCFAASGSRYSKTLRKLSITVQHSVSFFLSNMLVVVFTAAGVGSEYSQATEDPGNNLLVNNAIDMLLCAPVSLVLALLCDWLYKVRVFKGGERSAFWNKVVSRSLSALLLVVSLSSLVVVAMLTTGNNAWGNIYQYLYSVLLVTMVLDLVYAVMAFETRYYYSVTLLDGLLNPVLIGQYYLEALLRDGEARSKDVVKTQWRLLANSNVLVVTRVMPWPPERPALVRQHSAHVEMYATYSSGDSGASGSPEAAVSVAASSDPSRFEAVNPLHLEQRSLTGLAMLSSKVQSLPPSQRDDDGSAALLAAMDAGHTEAQMMLEAHFGDDEEEEEEGGRAERRARILAALSSGSSARRGSFMDKLVFFEERQQEQRERRRAARSELFVKANPLWARPRPCTSSARPDNSSGSGDNNDNNEKV